MFLEKYKYVARETDVEIYSDEENYDDSDEENSNEKIQMKKIKYINSFGTLKFLLEISKKLFFWKNMSF